ncbi:hypothetical protein GCM10025788_26450 [Serinicoccus chungangensis]
MSDLLQRTPVSDDSAQAKAASALDAWAEDVTPVIPPPGTVEPFLALLTSSPQFSGWTRVRRNLTVVTTVAPSRTDPPTEPGSSSPHPGTAALEELQGWLGLSLDELVRIVGLSPSTRAWWRQHPDAPVRPNKAGRLLRFRTAVGLLIGELGLQKGRAKLHEGGWLSGRLDDRRLGGLELAVQQLISGELQAPNALTGLTRDELIAAVSDVEDELVQQTHEKTRGSWKLGPEDSGAE